MGQLRTLLVLAVVGLLAAVSSARAMPGVVVTAANQVPECVTADRLMAFLQARNPRHHPRFDNIAAHYEAVGRRLGIRWDFAFFHMLLETGDLGFRRSASQPGPVAPEQNNFAEIGAAGEGFAGESFPDIRTGVQAHIEHLLVYAGARIAEPVAERTEKVQAWRVLDTWHQSLDRDVTFSDLARRWAMGNDNYVRRLAAIAQAFYGAHCSQTPVASTLLVKAPRLVVPRKAIASAAPQAGDDRDVGGGGWRARRPAETTFAAIAREVSDWQFTVKPKPSALGAGRELPLATTAAPPTTVLRPANTRPDPRLNEPGRSANGETRRVASLMPPAKTGTQRDSASQGAAAAPIARERQAGADQRARTIPQGETPAERLTRLLSGRKVHLTTSLGATIPMHFKSDGNLTGHANGYAFFLGSETDRGKWWIKKDKICTRWSRWLDRETQCIRITGERGGRYYWRSDEGKTGSARVAGG